MDKFNNDFKKSKASFGEHTAKMFYTKKFGHDKKYSNSAIK